jgi:hypothetical protein
MVGVPRSVALLETLTAPRAKELDSLVGLGDQGLRPNTYANPRPMSPIVLSFFHVGICNCQITMPGYTAKAKSRAAEVAISHD